MAFKVGDIVEGTVTGITKFGAFVKLEEGQVGLVHISEVADKYVENVKDFLQENQAVKVKVVSIDEKGKVGLSIKQVNKPAKERKPVRERSRDFVAPEKVKKENFEDKMNKFLKDSNEKMAVLKKYSESRKGR